MQPATTEDAGHTTAVPVPDSASSTRAPCRRQFVLSSGHVHAQRHLNMCHDGRVGRLYHFLGIHVFFMLLCETYVYYLFFCTCEIFSICDTFSKLIIKLFWFPFINNYLIELSNFVKKFSRGYSFDISL
jgi:hypothetical protein